MKDDSIKSPDKKEHPLYFIYPLCALIYGLLAKAGREDIAVKRASVERLYVNEDRDEMIRLEAYKTISYVIAVTVITVVISLLVYLKDTTSIYDGKLARKPAGEGEAKYELIVSRNDGSEEITVNVSEQRLHGSELESYFDSAFEKLEKILLAGNSSAEIVYEDLVFADSIEGTPIRVTWEDIDHDHIFSSGKIRSDTVSEPVIVYLTARLEYFDEVRIMTFPIRLVPKPEDPGTVFTEKLRDALKKEDAESSDTEWFTLPGELDGQTLGWGEKKEKQWLWILMLGLGAALAVIPAMRSETDSREKKREEEMLVDYPDIVAKFVLLVTAGMTCRSAWLKICTDYRQSGGKRYAYEEMLRSAKELEFGMSEGKVYEEFGRRCNIAVYRKFGTLLSNNLRRGSRDMTALLEQEAREAFDGRIEGVKKRAAQAGTRLLLPMFGMLCLVFAIVMVPALSAFGG